MEVLIGNFRYALHHRGSKVLLYCQTDKMWKSITPSHDPDPYYPDTLIWLKARFHTGIYQIEIKNGDDITVEGVKLYPMLVKFPGVYCEHWACLTQPRLPDNKEWTPFLFVSSDARANVMEYVTNKEIYSLGDVANYW